MNKITAQSELMKKRANFLSHFAKFLGEKNDTVGSASAKVAEFLGLSASFISQIRCGTRHMKPEQVDEIKNHLQGSAQHFDYPPEILLSPDKQPKIEKKIDPKVKTSGASKTATKSKPKANTARKKATRKKETVKTKTQVDSKAVPAKPTSQKVTLGTEEPDLQVAIATLIFNGSEHTAILLPKGRSLGSVQIDSEGTLTIRF